MDDNIVWKEAKTAQDFCASEHGSQVTEEELEQLSSEGIVDANEPAIDQSNVESPQEYNQQMKGSSFTFKQVNLSLKRNITALSDPSQHKPRPSYDTQGETFDTWLEESLVAISPNAESILFSGPNGNTFLAKLKFEPIDQYVIKPFNLALDYNEHVTSILCLPVMSTKKTSYGLVDWSVLVFGFSSGYVKFYTEQSTCLLSFKFCDEPVISLKCQTQKINSNARSECHFASIVDEILIVQKSLAILLDAVGLYVNLKIAKEDILRNGSHYEPAYTLSNLPSILNCQRWKIQDQSVSDADLLGIRLTSAFDALKAVSINPDAIRPKTLARTIGFVGQNPFLSCVKESIDSTNHSYTEMLGSLFSLWNKPQPSCVKINDLNNVSYLPFYDTDRRATSIVASPDKRLAAIADDFGRLMLIDVTNWLVIRTWKGYRSAQYGWVEVKKDQSKRSSPCASFLVIYAPKRGLLEVWSVQRGPRVAAFNVGKGCRLLYCGHRLLNQQGDSIGQPSGACHIANEQSFSSHCFLLNAKSGNIFAIELPYTYSLYRFSDLKSRDHLLIGELTSAIEQNQGADLCSEIIHRISLAESLRTAIRKVVFGLQSQKVAQIIESLVLKIVKNYDNHSGEVMCEDDEIITELCKRVIRLCEMFNELSKPSPYDLSLPEVNRRLIDQYEEHPTEVIEFAEELGWTATEILRYLSLLALERSFMTKHEPNPWPNLGEPLDWHEFIACFDLSPKKRESSASSPSHSESLTSCIKLLKFDYQFLCSDKVIKTALSMYSRLSESYYEALLVKTKHDSSDEVQNIMNSYNKLDASSRLILLFQFWLSSKLCNHWKMWAFLQSQVARISDELKVTSMDLHDDTLIVQTWKRIYELMLQSDNVFAAMIATAALKTETLRTINDREKSEKLAKLDAKQKQVNDNDSEQEGEDDDDGRLSSSLDWEHLCIDAERMSIVSQQFADVFLLNLLLRYSCTHGHLVDNFLYRITRLSVSNVLKGGPTTVTDLVAQWAVQSGIDLNLVTKPYGNEDQIESNIHIRAACPNDVGLPRNSRSLDKESRDEHARELLHHVRTAFPLSLRPELILVHCVWELCRRWSDASARPSDQRLLEKCLSSLMLIDDQHLSHKLAIVIYKTFFQLKFERLVGLIESNSLVLSVKNSRNRDQLTRKELALGEDCLDEFVQFCCDLSEFMLRTFHQSTNSTQPDESVEIKPSLLSVDNWWSTPSTVEFLYACGINNTGLPSCERRQSDESANSSLANCRNLHTNSIVKTTLQSSNVLSIDTLIEINRLASLMGLIFKLKLTKAYPVSLIGEESRQILHLDLQQSLSTTSKPLNRLQDQPSSLLDLRRKFARRCILSIVAKLDELGNQFSDQEYSQTIEVSKRRRAEKIDKAQQLATATAADQPKEGPVIDHFTISRPSHHSHGGKPASNQIDDDDDDELETEADDSCEENSESLRLFANLLSLASEWELDCDELHMEFVFELYRCNQDKIGAQLSVRVLDQQTLASGLLKVATQRALVLLGLSPQLVGNSEPQGNERWSLIQPSLLAWLKSVHLEEMRREIPPLSFAESHKVAPSGTAHLRQQKQVQQSPFVGLQVFVLHILRSRTELLLDTITNYLAGQQQQQRYARELLQLLDSDSGQACLWSAEKRAISADD